MIAALAFALITAAGAPPPPDPFDPDDPPPATTKTEPKKAQDPSDASPAAPAAPKPMVVLVQLQPLGVDEAIAVQATQHVADHLRGAHADKLRVRVTTAEQAKQKQACRDASCFTDLLGDDGKLAMWGSVQALGGGFVVVLNAPGAHTVAKANDAKGLKAAAAEAVDTIVRTTNLTSPASPPVQKPNAKLTPLEKKLPSTDAPTIPGQRNDDFLLLLADYALILVPVPGGICVVPLLQGVIHGFVGEQLVENQYPNWWMGSVAGYATLLGGGTVFLGMYFFGAVLASTGNLAGIALVLGGLAVLLVTVIAEPAIVWAVAGIDAVAVAPRDERRSDAKKQQKKKEKTQEQTAVAVYAF